jgi:hypothetical protein
MPSFWNCLWQERWHRRIWCFLRYRYICRLFGAAPNSRGVGGIPRNRDSSASATPFIVNCLGKNGYNDCGTKSKGKPASKVTGAGIEQSGRQGSLVGYKRTAVIVRQNHTGRGIDPGSQRPDRRGSSQASELAAGNSEVGHPYNRVPEPDQCILLLGASEAQSTPFKIQRPRGAEPMNPRSDRYSRKSAHRHSRSPAVCALSRCHDAQYSCQRCRDYIRP